MLQRCDDANANANASYVFRPLLRFQQEHGNRSMHLSVFNTEVTIYLVQMVPRPLKSRYPIILIIPLHFPVDVKVYSQGTERI